MHAVIDSERKARNAKVGGLKKFQQDNADYAFQRTRDRNLVGSITDPAKQHGKAMTTTRFMQKLHKLNRDIVMVPHPHIEDKAVLYLQVADQRIMLMPIEREHMLEWSLHKTKKSRRPYADITGFWEEVDIPGEEISRGWRTVLIRLIKKQILRLDAVEREFGTGGRPSWYAQTGKGFAKLPI